MATAARSREDALLKVLAANPTASQADLANLLGWKMRDGRPYKVRVKPSTRRSQKGEADYQGPGRLRAYTTR